MNMLDILTDPRLFVQYWFKEKNLTVKANLILNEQNQTFDADLVFKSMWLDYKRDLFTENSERSSDERIRGFVEGDLKKAFEEFLEKKRQDALNIIRESIKSSGENLGELRRFLIAATGKCSEIELAVMAHSIWQVKRKLFNRKVKDHVMVVLRGPQGGGKTEALKVLFEPVKAWFKNASLKEVADERWKLLFRNALVIFCDELQHAEWASVDSLKNIISSDELETRILGTNTYSNVRQNCTFIGASNRPLAEIIRDPSGMRRFFEIETLPKMDWQMINNLDVLALWRGIDENCNETYIEPFKHEIGIIQKDLILPDGEEEFIGYFNLLDSSTEREFLSNNAVYKLYEHYCKQNGERTKPSVGFHRKIKGLGLRQYEDRHGHHGERGYQLSLASHEKIKLYKSKYPVF
ncbi:MAG: hypothetical protein JNM39_09685 [Bdellovibrionaceae bacterium]|nr:hypothetical protein [Pseudobdellovibrionaceae bacterium]